MTLPPTKYLIGGAVLLAVIGLIAAWYMMAPDDGTAAATLQPVTPGTAPEPVSMRTRVTPRLTVVPDVPGKDTQDNTRARR